MDIDSLPDLNAPKKKFNIDDLPDLKKVDNSPDEMMQHALGMSYGAGSLNKALMSTPESAFNLISGTVKALSHPIDTGKGLADIIGGGLGKIIPDQLRTNDQERNARQDAVFNHARDYFINRLGGIDNIKNTFETDPVGLLADVSTILTPINPKVATAINPINMAIKGTAKAAPAIGSVLADLIGGLGTKTGGETIKEAARAGMAGGSKEEAFLNNINDTVPMTDVVEVAEQGQNNLANKSYQDYLSSTQGSFSNQTPLDFQRIRDAVQRSNAIDITPEGIDLNPSTAPVKKNIADLVNEFDSRGLSTIRNFDEMKRGIHNIVKNTDPSKPEYRAAMNVYGELKNTINDLDPAYGKAMEKSQESMNILDELKRELSLNPKANIGTTLRKLQSTTRNNANTSYGQRVSLAKLLEDNGADNLNAMLAGQALNTWQPRGIAGALSGGSAVGGYMAGGAPAAIAALGLQSPKLMGFSAYGAGLGAKGIKTISDYIDDISGKTGISPSIISNLLYQSQQGNQ
jgi:hypothetical protein